MPFVCHHRAAVQAPTLVDLLGQVETTEDRVWLSRTEACLRYTLLGVPARLIDLCITEGPCPDPAWYRLVAEVGCKTGRYDGAERWTVNVRWWGVTQRTWNDAANAARPVHDGGELVACPGAGRTVLALAWPQGDGWVKAFPRLRTSLEGYDLAAIVMWHRERYYQHLPYEEARALADSFEPLVLEQGRLRDDAVRAHAARLGLHGVAPAEGVTLAEANRLASRELYRASTALGWRKLSADMKARFGLAPDSPQWVRAEALPTRSPTGCGRYTLDAAVGRSMSEVGDDGDLRTAYGPVEVE